MPRPRRFRKVWFRPEVTYFKPAGVPLSALEETVLTVDELEALRLHDLEAMDQEQAAKKMDISQPTFNRLLRSARKKVAQALVNGQSIKIEGGVYRMAGPIGRGRGTGMGRGPGRGRGRGRGFGAGGSAMECVCPVCGTRQLKALGVPCSQVRCPKCGAFLVRG